MDEAASEVAETAPVALVYKVPDGALEIVRFVVLAEPKYPVPETVSAVLLAYGNVLACDVDVAMKYAAVGVEVAATVPLELTHSKELERFASERLPAVSKEEVAVAPKYAGPYAEKSVVDAPAENIWSDVHVFAVVVEKVAESVLPENERPLPTVSAPTAPVPFVESIEDGVPESVRLVVEAVPK